MTRHPAVGILLEVTLLLGAVAAPLSAQSAAGQATPIQSTAATGSRLAFDVASVKPNKSDDQPNSNFPLGPGDVYTPNGGFFSATNQPLIAYIAFAYRIMSNQAQYLRPQLPEWVTTDRFDIQARAEGNPGKDQMRLLMRSMLADRFRLAIHTETREVPVLAFVLLKPGLTGRRLWRHPNDASFSEEDRAMFRRACPPSVASAPGSAASPVETASGETRAGELPESCKGRFGVRPTAPGRVRFVGRKRDHRVYCGYVQRGNRLRSPDDRSDRAPRRFRFQHRVHSGAKSRPACAGFRAGRLRAAVPGRFEGTARDHARI